MRRLNLGAVCLLAAASVTGLQAQTSVLAEGLQLPYKIILTDAGNLVVSEGGTKPNTGRISLVTRGGTRRSLVEGLPSGPSNPEMTPMGPTGLAMRDRTLYVAIGEGDAVRAGATQGSLVLNPAGASSPLFSSVLRFRFEEDPDRVMSPFQMTMADQLALIDGDDVVLTNADRVKVMVSLLVKFNVLAFDSKTVYRHSDPFGLALDTQRRDTLYLVDSGQNTLVRIDPLTGQHSVAARFAPIPNPTKTGPPVMDSVPTAAMVMGDEILVSYLSGFPFVPGQSGVRTVNPETKAVAPWLNWQNSLIDLGRRRTENGVQFLVLSFSSNMGANPAGPGELWSSDASGAKKQATLVTPTGLAVDSAAGEAFVTELGTGRIQKVKLQ